MTEKTPQDYGNHRKFVPLYHFVTAGILLLNLVYAVSSLIRSPGADTGAGLLVAVALILLFWYARIFPLAVQDRLICLEMRLRLQALLPDDLRARLDELEPGQLIALRFAGDEELAELVRRVLEEGIKGREAIKKEIRHWRPDYMRA